MPLAAADPEHRQERLWGRGTKDQRSEAQRDRDRILYCSAFRRLAGVTQVVAPVEGYVFHNRLTHTLETAQIARRLAEWFVVTKRDLTEALGGVDPDVVESAALVHDLGHPPFGHTGEKTLNRLALDMEDDEGFEGNAQSFRIVTRLAAHRMQYPGLNLTRATLNASLKYPWFRRADKRKFGVYRSDTQSFDFARDRCAEGLRSAEAEIMDYADDVAYSVHDLDDLIRAGLIPIHRLLHDREEFDRFIEDWKARPDEVRRVSQDDIEGSKESLHDWLNFAFKDVPPDPTFDQRASMRYQTAGLIGELVKGATLHERQDDRVLSVSNEHRIRMRFCQRLVWHFVIEGARLATLQYGQREIITKLFTMFHDAAERRDPTLIPPRFHKQLEESDPETDSPTPLAIDIITSLTDEQALMLYRRLTGMMPGSVSDFIEG